MLFVRYGAEGYHTQEGGSGWSARRAHGERRTERGPSRAREKTNEVVCPTVEAGVQAMRVSGA